MMKMMPIHSWKSSLPIVLVASLFCLTGCHKSGDSETDENSAVPVQAATAGPGAISRVVKAEAVIFPLSQAAITPKISAPVRKFYIVRGQRVHQGQLLAVLENRDLSAAAMDNKGTLEQAQAAYKTSVGATVPEDAQKAELDVQSAKQAYDAEQKLFESRENLFNQGALPRKDLDQARVSLVQARSQYEIARKHLDSLNALVKEQSLKAASGQLASAQGKYMGAEAQLSYSEIRSPMEGVITDRPLYPGEMASTSVPLLTVMDISSVIAKAHIPEGDAAMLHQGDKATITAPGDEPVAGTVTLISPALDPNSTTVEIWVQAKNSKQPLRPGATAEIAITAKTLKDALLIPAAALLNATGDQAQVMVIDAKSTAVKRDVKTGIVTADQVQIVSGLKAGEQVVTQGAYGLAEKRKVKIEKPDAAEGASSGDDKGKDDKD